VKMLLSDLPAADERESEFGSHGSTPFHPFARGAGERAGKNGRAA
jgi:hypothetical protein